MSAPQELPPIPPIIVQLTGPVLLGHLFNWGLFGAVGVQTYIYYLAFPRDRNTLKGLVAFTFGLELLQTVLSTRDAFRDLGSGWGNMIQLDEVGWLWFSVPVLGSVMSATAQMFYAWRIWVLSGKLWVPIPIIILALLQGSVGVYTGAFAHIIGVFSEVQKKEFRTTSVWLGGTALCDIIIACSMVYYLHKSNTGFRSTSTILTRFIRITIETGLICATFAILDLSLFLAFQENNYHLAPSIALGKLYSNSLLVVLNARVRITGGRNGDTATSFETMSRTKGINTLPYVRSDANSKNNGAAINVEISQVSDAMEMDKIHTSSNDNFSYPSQKRPTDMA